MNFGNVAIFGWIEAGAVHIKVFCREHMAEGVLATTAAQPKRNNPILVCSHKGCPLGEWRDEQAMKRDFRKLEDLFKNSAQIVNPRTQ